jgi:uncharacterized coiled-coil protein SlyX
LSIQRLEAAIAHQQRDYEALNEVVVEQAKQLVALQRQVLQLETTLRAISEQLQSGDWQDEKPPHY